MAIFDGDDFDNILEGTAASDTIRGFGGNDYIIGGPGTDTLRGGAGIDTLSYEDAVDPVVIFLNGLTYGAAGGDIISGFENLVGGQGDDTLYGDDGDNTIYGGAGNDSLSGFGGDDQIFGGDGDDTVLSSLGSDHFDGGSGRNEMNYAASNAGVTIDLQNFIASGGHAEGDTLQQVTEIMGSHFGDMMHGDGQANIFYGNDGDDVLYGRAGNDNLSGWDGSDILIGGTGADQMSGNGGNDTASYYTASGSVGIALDQAFLWWGDAAGDSLVDIENLTGGGYNDELRGNDDNNVLNGLSGSDTLTGKGGNDELLGLIGADTMSGGNGNDRFMYYNTNQGGDLINGFSSTGAGNNDSLWFLSSSFGGLPAGELAANRFLASASSQAETVGQRFIYETDTGILRYDENGSDAGGVTIIATLEGAPAITLDDIVIF